MSDCMSHLVFKYITLEYEAHNIGEITIKLLYTIWTKINIITPILITTCIGLFDARNHN